MATNQDQKQWAHLVLFFRNMSLLQGKVWIINSNNHFNIVIFKCLEGLYHREFNWLYLR